jgi:hypothetical protein
MRPLHTAFPFILSLGACAPRLRSVPPGPAPVRQPTEVQASFGQTWDAVIDLFAQRNIPIRTIERASGIIAAEVLTVDSLSGIQYADCGQVPGIVKVGSGWNAKFVQQLVPLPAERAFYNILVRGDSTRSTVLATVRWSVPERTAFVGNKPYTRAGEDCSTRGIWEESTETAVRDRAKAADASQGRPTASTAAPTRRSEAAAVSTPRPMSSSVTAPAQGTRSGGVVPVTVLVDITGTDGAKYPIENYSVLVVGAQGDSTYLQTDDTGTARGTLRPGRYRIVRYRDATLRGQAYYWELAFIVSSGMPAVTLSSENARRP